MTENLKTVDATAMKKKRVNVLMEEQMHREMSAAAALMGMTKSDYVVMAIREQLRRKPEGGQT